MIFCGFRRSGPAIAPATPIAPTQLRRFNPHHHHHRPGVQIAMQASGQLFQDLLATFGIKDNQRYPGSHLAPPAQSTRHTPVRPLEIIPTLPSMDNRPPRNGAMLHHQQLVGSFRAINSMQDLWTTTTPSPQVSNASPPPSAPGSINQSSTF